MSEYKKREGCEICKKDAEFTYRYDQCNLKKFQPVYYFKDNGS